MGVGDQGRKGQEDSNEKRKFDRSMISLSPLQIRKYPDGTELLVRNMAIMLLNLSF